MVKTMGIAACMPIATIMSSVMQKQVYQARDAGFSCCRKKKLLEGGKEVIDTKTTTIY